jgi:hypothetical protein
LPLLGRVFSIGSGQFELTPKGGWDTCDAWSQYTTSNVEWWYAQSATTVVTDVNGDGLTDFVTAIPITSTPDRISGIRVLDDVSLPTFEDVRDWRVGDFSGKGKETELAYVTQDTTGAQVSTAIVDDNGNYKVTQQSVYPAASAPPQDAGNHPPQDADNRHWRVADVGSRRDTWTADPTW